MGQTKDYGPRPKIATAKPDEAQALVFPMPESAKKGITEVSLKLYVGVSMQINGKDWLKTSAEGGMKWNTVPTEEELAAANSFIQKGQLEPAIDQMVTLLGEQLKGINAQR